MTILKDQDIKSGSAKDQMTISKSDVKATGICRFTNARSSGACLCHLEYAYGGFTNFVLSGPGDYHEIHVRDAAPFDTFCWFSDHNPNTCGGSGNPVRPGYNYNLVD